MSRRRESAAERLDRTVRWRLAYVSADRDEAAKACGCTRAEVDRIVERNAFFRSFR